MVVGKPRYLSYRSEWGQETRSATLARPDHESATVNIYMASLDGYCLWLGPSPSEAANLKDTIRDLARTTPGSPIFDPHVTLLSPVSLTLPIWEVLASLERAVTRASIQCSLDNFQLELGAAQSGTFYFQSVLAPVKATPALLALRSACEEEFGVKPSKPFFPHLSLLYGDISNEQRDAIASDVNARNLLPDRINVGSVTIVLAVGEADKWEIVSSVDFGHDL